MIRAGRMTLVTREPFVAAIELNGDNIEFAMIMSAPRLTIDLDSVNLFAVYFSHHYLLYLLYLPVNNFVKVSVFGKMK